MKVNIKYGDESVTALTDKGITELNTSGKYTSKNIILDVVEFGIKEVTSVPTTWVADIIHNTTDDTYHVWRA